MILLRIIKFENIYDVELSFGEPSTANANMIMRDMYKFANGLRKKFHIHEVYGGMEPAIDMKTRFFTNRATGPLPFD